MARRRASMREGPLAELFRATEAAQRQSEGQEPAGEQQPLPAPPPTEPEERTVEHVPSWEEASRAEVPPPAPPPPRRPARSPPAPARHPAPRPPGPAPRPAPPAPQPPQISYRPAPPPPPPVYEPAPTPPPVVRYADPMPERSAALHRAPSL